MMAAKNLHSYPQIRRAPNIGVRPRESAPARPSQAASSRSSPSKRPLAPDSDGEEEVYDWESSDEERKRKRQKEGQGKGKGKRVVSRSEQEEEEAMWDQIDGITPLTTPTKKPAPFSFSAGGTSAAPTAQKTHQAGPVPATPKSQVATTLAAMPITPPRTVAKSGVNSSPNRLTTPAATPSSSNALASSPQIRPGFSPEPQDPLALLTSLTPTLDLLQSSLTRQSRLLKANKLSLEAKDKALKAREGEVKALQEEVRGLRGRVRVLEEEREGWMASKNPPGR